MKLFFVFILQTPSQLLFVCAFLSTNCILLTETKPEIYNPDRDQFFTQSEGDKEQKYNFQCAANGNPTPLVNWYKIEKDGTEIDLSIDNPESYLLTILGGDLVGGRNLYICRASNRQAVVNRSVSIVVTTDIIESDVILETNEQIDNQESLNGEQATNLANLVDSVILQVMEPKLNLTSSNGTNVSAIVSASELFRNVIDRWDGNGRSMNNLTNDTNEDQTLFNTNTGLIRSTQVRQNGSTALTDQLVSLEFTIYNFFEITTS